MVVLSLLLSCEVPVSYVTMSGSVFSGPLDIAEPVPQMTLRSRDMGLSLVDTVTTDSEGAFEIELPAGGYFFLSMEGEGFRTTSLTGISGASSFSVEDGIIWARQESVMQEIEQLFEGCPGGGEGGVIEGEVRAYIPGYEPEELPLAKTAWATAYDEEGKSYDACYLADTPHQHFDPEAQYTGQQGRFAIMGLPSGPITLEVGWDAGGVTVYAGVYYVFMPQDGTAAFYPAWVDL